MRRPNILILYTDQQRWDALGANGNDEIHTPNLDRLAAEGVNFDHYFVQNPVCMPSRVSFLTGQYPSTLRLTHMGVPVPEDTVTLPAMLANYGYDRANIGKLHFLPHANREHRDTHPAYGFNHLEISDEPGCYADAYRAWVRRVAPEELDNVSLGLPPATETWHRMMNVRDGIEHPEERFPKEAVPFRGRSDVSHTAFVATQTIEYVEQHQDRPFLCISGFYSPHSPWVAPQEFLDLYDPETLSVPEFPPDLDARRSPDSYSDDELRRARHGYYAMVSEVDHHVGRILDRLDDLGIADNTIVVFTSDHGEWLGEHLKYGKGYPGHDCVSRVPLIVRWPGGELESGRVVSELVEGVDVVPTLLECAGIPVPPHVQGGSLAPTLRGEDAPAKECALMEMHGWKTLRTRDHRYVLRASGEEMLFDLRVDPMAYRDLSDDPASADTLADCRLQLARRVIEIESPLPRSWQY